MATIKTYAQALDILAGRCDKDDRDALIDDAREFIASAVWHLAKEEGNGYGELVDWIAMGDWSGAEGPAYDADALSAEWDEQQRLAREEAQERAEWENELRNKEMDAVAADWAKFREERGF